MQSGRRGGWEGGSAKKTAQLPNLPLSLSPNLPLSHRCSAETPERRHAPPRCSDVSFIVKHLPRRLTQKPLHSKRMLQPREGGPTKSRNSVKPTMKPQRISS